MFCQYQSFNPPAYRVVSHAAGMSPASTMGNATPPPTCLDGGDYVQCEIGSRLLNPTPYNQEQEYKLCVPGKTKGTFVPTAKCKGKPWATAFCNKGGQWAQTEVGDWCVPPMDKQNDNDVMFAQYGGDNTFVNLATGETFVIQHLKPVSPASVTNSHTRCRQCLRQCEKSYTGQELIDCKGICTQWCGIPASVQMQMGVDNQCIECLKQCDSTACQSKCYHDYPNCPHDYPPLSDPSDKCISCLNQCYSSGVCKTVQPYDPDHDDYPPLPPPELSVVALQSKN